ncbi:DUF456 domain-containing protein [Cellulomonas sp. ATA003]|uniref:DUF456 domain-containing protein n=1 Tax=Cellulomonas sp. ATA003 TaxID=3073064 RepID=UPI002873BE5E|nr:DUF456 domain-containing protein [Cellulomonas sp. ATA003]WNB86074.1 DUF456 domain-containing protein [Cellulomonas sp. ATA003]
MNALGEVLVGLVILIGLVGVVVQVIPGSLLVLGAVIVWAVLEGTGIGWAVAVLATLVTAAALVAKYLVAGRHLKRAGVPNRTLVIGGLAGIVGFFVVPVVGLFLGFVLAVYLVELSRLGDATRAWRATVVALQATGITILIELAGALIASAAWLIAVLAT